MVQNMAGSGATPLKISGMENGDALEKTVRILPASLQTWMGSEFVLDCPSCTRADAEDESRKMLLRQVWLWLERWRGELNGAPLDAGEVMRGFPEALHAAITQAVGEKLERTAPVPRCSSACTLEAGHAGEHRAPAGFRDPGVTPPRLATLLGVIAAVAINNRADRAGLLPGPIAEMIAIIGGEAKRCRAVSLWPGGGGEEICTLLVGHPGAHQWTSRQR